MLSIFFSSQGMDEHPTAYLFQWQHFLYIAICILMFMVLLRLFRNQSVKTRKIFVTILLILMLFLKYAGEAIFVSEWYAYATPVSSYSHTFWDWRTFFSFQMCGVNNVLLPFVVWFDLKKMKDFVYTTSIIGGIAVMIYPVGVLYGEPLMITLPMLRSLIVHFLLVFVPIFLIVTNEFTLEKKNWKNTLVGAALMTSWAMFGNLFVDPSANNMYLMTNPFFGGPVPLLNILPDGLHMIALSIMVFLGFLVVYAVIGFIQRQRDHLNVKNTA